MMLLVRIARALAALLSSSRYIVDGDSMLPNLASGEHVLALPVRLPARHLRRGDVVVLWNPVLRDRIYIKRVVGLPDEEIRLEAGRVYLNGALLEEACRSSPTVQGNEDRREWWTGPDEYFVLGDNRSGSQDDSRAFGPVSGRLIIGRVWFRCWPVRAWGPIAGGLACQGRGDTPAEGKGG